MTEHVRQHLFEPFFTTKDVDQGTGLGLATVFGCIRQHGGFITVDSTPGRGTTFEILLPAGERMEVTTAETTEVPAMPGKGTILVVDDEQAVRESAVEMLASLGYDVHSCNDGREAVELFESHRQSFDAVLLDLIMPKMDGEECYRRIREIDPAIRVVVATGYSDRVKESEILQQGAAGLIRKPYRLSELSRMLARATVARHEQGGAQ